MGILKWSFNVLCTMYWICACVCVCYQDHSMTMNHKFMCLQNAVTILHTNHLFVKYCDNFIKVFHKQINQCADFVM